MRDFFLLFLGSTEVALELDMMNETQGYDFRKTKVPVTKILFSDNTPSMSVNICVFFHFPKASFTLQRSL